MPVVLLAPTEDASGNIAVDFSGKATDIAPMNGIEHLLAVARAYADSTNLDLSAVSWRSLGDSKKLGAIEAGADITVGRLERTLQWFSDHWPDVPWPSDVPRPPVSEPAEARA